jgi:hypothetical protein
VRGERSGERGVHRHTARPNLDRRVDHRSLGELRHRHVEQHLTDANEVGRIARG